MNFAAGGTIPRSSVWERECLVPDLKKGKKTGTRNAMSQQQYIVSYMFLYARKYGSGRCDRDREIAPEWLGTFSGEERKKYFRWRVRLSRLAFSLVVSHARGKLQFPNRRYIATNLPYFVNFLKFFPTLEFFGPHDEPSGGILSFIFLRGENWVSVSGWGPPGEITGGGGGGGGGDWQPHYRAAREKVWVSKVFFFPSMQWRKMVGAVFIGLTPFSWTGEKGPFTQEFHLEILKSAKKLRRLKRGKLPVKS